MRTSPVGKLLNLEQLQDEIEKAPWNYSLFVKGPRPWNDETPCAILKRDDDNPDQVPELAVKFGLENTLLVEDVRDIFSNARQQKPDVSNTQLIQALNFYMDHDAFIEF